MAGPYDSYNYYHQGGYNAQQRPYSPYQSTYPDRGYMPPQHSLNPDPSQYRQESFDHYYGGANSYDGAQYYQHQQPPPHWHESDRGLGGALTGGAAGAWGGHKAGHGVLGAVGGAILGSLTEEFAKKHHKQKKYESPNQYSVPGQHGQQYPQQHHGHRKHHHHKRHHNSSGNILNSKHNNSSSIFSRNSGLGSMASSFFGQKR